MRTEWTDGLDHAPNMAQLEIAKLIVHHKDLQYAFGRLLTRNEELGHAGAAFKPRKSARSASATAQSCDTHSLHRLLERAWGAYPMHFIKDPNRELLKGIEDFAAEGRLHEWSDTGLNDLVGALCAIWMVSFKGSMIVYDVYDVYDGVWGLPIGG
jgi:hypothetical protein